MTIKLDQKRPYGVVYGDPMIKYEQDGVYFDGQMNLLGTPAKVAPKLAKIEALVTDQVANAQDFLKNILNNNPLAKNVVYKTAGDTNIQWDHVKRAADLLGVLRYRNGPANEETWRLPEKV